MLKRTCLFLLITLCSFTNHRVAAQDKFLLIVDVQKKFCDIPQYKAQAEEMIQKINHLIDKTDPSHVIYIKATGKVLSVSWKGIKAKPMEPAPELDGRLKKVSNNIFTKTEGDAFTVTLLNRLLTQKSAKEIIVVGMLAEKCVYNTVLGGLGKGYQMTVVPEAVIGGTEAKKAKALGKMEQKGVRFLHYADAIKKSW